MHGAIETYLSDNVRLILVEYGLSYQNVAPKSSQNFIELPDILYNWKYIKSSFSEIEDDLDVCNQCEEWYLENIKIVWAAIHAAGSAMNAADSCGKKRLCLLAGWVCDPFQLSEFYHSTEKDDDGNILLSILHMTAFFERAIRNLYLLKSTPAPFLLRDLLKSKEISDILGKVPTLFTQLVLGCPKGLNLRNVTWHGFVSPGELHSDLVSGLIVLFASLRHLLPVDLGPSKSHFTNTFEHFHKDLNKVFPDLRNRQSEVLDILKSSPYLNKRLLIYWEKAFKLFLLDRFGDCLVLLIPQLEHCLRVMFCQVNDCPTRLLTAESTSLYTTLDEILVPSTEPVLGEGLLMMLLDLTASMSGPRLRDKLSHGECDLANVPGWFANHVLALALAVSHHKVNCGESLCSEFESAALLYRSKFHVFATLYQLTDTLLAEWEDLHSCTKPPSDLPVDLDPCACNNVSALDAMLFLNINLLSEKISSARDVLSHSNPATLFRPRFELEIASSLANVVRRVSETCKTIKSTASGFELQWRGKTLRSRSRQTALRMWSVLPDLFSTLLSLLMTISVVYNRLPTLMQVKEIQRLVKSMTKVVENTVVLCSGERNRWMEAHELASSLATEICAFLLDNKHTLDIT